MKERAMYQNDPRMYRRRNPLRGLAGGIFLIFLLLGFLFGGGGLFLPLLFVGLAFCVLIGSISTYHPRGIYSGVMGMVWMLGLALCFLIGFWPWILLPVALSMILGALINPITGALAGSAFLALNQPQQPTYQPVYQAPPQPQAAPGTYQEGGNSYPYPPEQPPEGNTQAPPTTPLQ
jgi:hypothetical protein